MNETSEIKRTARAPISGERNPESEPADKRERASAINHSYIESPTDRLREQQNRQTLSKIEATNERSSRALNKVSKQVSNSARGPGA